ncbi:MULTISPECIES: hypothetical protein [unclassified Streptomyces]|uniref:hypothetical protein n=1 Tax=unclassified Streptomyces TaxID=2593676 RepID=UPI002E2AF818|nr:hypothetical protein [Streptomyces sp. NBC_01439]
MDRPLPSLRSTLVLLLALLAGTVPGGLTAVTGAGAARILLAGIAVVGPAVPFFGHPIDTDGRGTAKEQHHG